MIPDGAQITIRGRAKRDCKTLPDELPQHRLGDLEVGDHAVPQRPVGGDRGRRAADHPLRVGADRVDLAGALIDRDDRRLGQHDPAPAHVDHRVGGAEVHGDVTAGAQAADGPSPARAAEQSFMDIWRPLKHTARRRQRQTAPKRGVT